MIEFEIDKLAIRTFCEKMNQLPFQTRKNVLKNSVNATARSARKIITDRAKKAYTAKISNMNKAMTIKKASNYNLEATITAKGKPLELKSFKVSPAKPPATQKIGSTTKAKVYSSSPMKKLEYKGIKAFVAEFKSGHVSVAQRKTKKRLPIKVLYSTSIPRMVGNEEMVFNEIKDKIQVLFDNNVQINLKKVIERENRLKGK
jgi:hypothetical protein